MTRAFSASHPVGSSEGGFAPDPGGRCSGDAMDRAMSVDAFAAHGVKLPAIGRP